MGHEVYVLVYDIFCLVDMVDPVDLCNKKYNMKLRIYIGHIISEPVLNIFLNQASVTPFFDPLAKILTYQLSAYK